MINRTVSNITWRAYDHITSQSGLVFWCNHKRLWLKRIERNVFFLKIILLESVKTLVATSLTMLVPRLIMPWVMPHPPRLMILTPTECVTIVSICDLPLTRFNLFIRITYFIFILIQIMIFRIVDCRCIFIFPRWLIFIYLCYIIDVTFMSCFSFILQISDCMVKLIIVYSSITSDVLIDKAFRQLIIVSIFCWLWHIVSL